MGQRLETSPLEQLAAHGFTDRHCILCGREPPPEELSREHVFPRWLQREFNLWDKTLTLTNGTSIPYRQLTVACCKKCNSVYLKRLEDDVCAAARGGRAGLQRLPKVRLFQWLAKLFLGILIKETGLRLDRLRDDSPPIVDPAFLRERYRLLMFWLSTVRASVTSFGAQPTSIFLREAQVPRDVDEQFDFVDNLHAASVAVRMGNVAIFAHFLDVDLHTEQLGPEFHDLFPFPLHPIQFREMAARFIYKNLLLEAKVDTVIEEASKGLFKAIFTPSALRSDGTMWADWNEAQYATLLAHYWEVPKERVFEPPDRVVTLLRDSLHRHQFLDVRLRYRFSFQEEQ